MRPMEWAARMLKVLICEYEDNPARFSDPGQAIDIWELAVKAGIISGEKVSMQDFYSGHPFRDAIDTVIAEMKRREWISTDSTFAQTWVFLLPAGIDEGRRIIRPWYRKVWDFFKGDVRTIIIAVITALIITLLTNWLLRVLG
jgi:hypothetical protein